jgi:molybdopterin/thiamine biosynthesis adenylyltransferase
MAINNRFKDAPWVRKERIIVGGVGGIGSWVALFLSRIGYDIVIYDNDVFEEHNMGGQFVDKKSIGVSKVNAMKSLIQNFGGTGRIMTYNELYDNDSMSGKYMIAAFDNMSARKIMFENWFDYNKSYTNENALFIDGKLLMEQMQILCVTPTRTKAYRENHLFSDDEVPDAACSLQQTSHSAAMIASFMVGFFTNHITNVLNGNKARAVPFENEYFIPLNMLNNEFN